MLDFSSNNLQNTRGIVVEHNVNIMTFYESLIESYPDLPRPPVLHFTSMFLHFHSLHRILTTIVYQLFWFIYQIKSDHPKTTKEEYGFRYFWQLIRNFLPSLFDASWKLHSVLWLNYHWETNSRLLRAIRSVLDVWQHLIRVFHQDEDDGAGIDSTFGQYILIGRLQPIGLKQLP